MEVPDRSALVDDPGASAEPGPPCAVASVSALPEFDAIRDAAWCDSCEVKLIMKVSLRALNEMKPDYQHLRVC
jgi:hypothetical protein